MQLVAYYAAVAALAKIAFTRTCSTLTGFFARASKKVAAWHYARKYLSHLTDHAIAFDELPSEPRSPRRDSSAGLPLPPITESEDEDAVGSSPACKRSGPPAPARLWMQRSA